MEAAIAEAAQLERPEWKGRQRLQFARLNWFARLGRHEEALACAQRQAVICREDGNLLGELYAMSNVTGEEIALGRTEIALEHARASIAQLDAIGAGVGAGHLYNNMMLALALLDRVDEALAAGRIAHALLLREGDEIRVFTPLALCTALRGRFADAARIQGFVNAELARTGALRASTSTASERLDALLTGGLTPEELARYKAAGATMRKGDVFELACGGGV
jgi:tetratricopeptide (TPR) repeat protein